MSRLSCKSAVLLLFLGMANSEARPVFRFFMSNRISLSALGAVRNISQAQVDTLTSSDQPRSALFQRESTASQLTMGFGWFLFGLHILIALLFSGLSGYTAISKGLNPIPYFFIGFFLSAFGFLYVLTRPSVAKPGDVPAGLVKVHTTLEPVPCPKCGNTNHPAAKKCLNCGSELQPLAQSDVVRAK